MTFRVAAIDAVTDAFHISNSSGTNLSGNINVPATGGWQTWTNVTVNSQPCRPEQQTLTINQDNAGWNINLFSFATTSAAKGRTAGRRRRFPERCRLRTTTRAARVSPTT